MGENIKTAGAPKNLAKSLTEKVLQKRERAFKNNCRRKNKTTSTTTNF